MIKGIYEFDPVIYPFKVWVAKRSVTIEQIDHVFVAICEDDTGCSFKDNHSLPTNVTAAQTFIVGHKKSGFMGCLVVFGYNTKMKNLSHEASHCADWLFQRIGEDKREYERGECYAYYQSWVFDCLYKVFRGKI